MKKEVCNAYTELNDPIRQRELFEQQAKVQKLNLSLFSHLYSRTWPHYLCSDMMQSRLFCVVRFTKSMLKYKLADVQ